MEPTSAASEDKLLRHIRVALVATLLAAVCGSASAQTVPVLITVRPVAYMPVNPEVCDPNPKDPTNKICVNAEPVRTPDVDVDGHVAIWWTLDSTTATNKGWFFDSDGIYIKNKKWLIGAGPPGTGTLPFQYVAVALKENGNNKYTYKINLINGNMQLKWDPTIRN